MPAQPAQSSRRKRPPSAFGRWLRGFVQWGVVLVLVLVASSYAAWGIGHFLWVARGREGQWRDRQLENMMGRFMMMAGPTRNDPPEGGYIGRDRETVFQGGTVRSSSTRIPPGLAFARISTGLPEDSFVEFATLGNTQWSINEPQPAGWFVHMAEVQQLRMLANPRDEVHPWTSAGPGAVYRKDAAGIVTHCTLQFESPWDARTPMPLERLILVWGEPAAIAWSGDRAGRVAAVWILREKQRADGVERQMVLLDWRSTPPSFGRRARASLHLHMFDSRDALWKARRPTGGLMPTDPLADSMREQLANPAWSAIKRIAAFDADTAHLGDGAFAKLFGFGRMQIAGFTAALNPNARPARVRRAAPAQGSGQLVVPSRPAPAPAPEATP